jgi:DNA-binding NarL/FixJ family response regulator
VLQLMASAAPTAPPSALVVAGEEETRVLLRGLLRLHRFRIVGEAEGSVRALALIKEQEPTTLVIDTTLSEGDALELVQDAKRTRPNLRVVVVARGAKPIVLPGMTEPDVVLQRPFRIQEFAQAVEAPERVKR